MCVYDLWAQSANYDFVRSRLYTDFSCKPPSLSWQNDQVLRHHGAQTDAVNTTEDKKLTPEKKKTTTTYIPPAVPAMEPATFRRSTTEHIPALYHWAISGRFTTKPYHCALPLSYIPALYHHWAISLCSTAKPYPSALIPRSHTTELYHSATSLPPTTEPYPCPLPLSHIPALYHWAIFLRYTTKP